MQRRVGGYGFLTHATDHLGLHGCVLDTKFGTRYDVREPLALARIRQDVSAGKCVTGMIPPPRQDTSYSPKVISASAAIANLLHRARMPWILEHLCDSWLWYTPKIQSLSAQPRTVWALADFCVLGSQSRKRRWFLVGNVDSRRFAPYCSQVKQVDVAVCLDRNMFLQVLPHHAQNFCSSRDNTRATTFPENTSFKWNGICTQRVKGYCYGSY